MAVRNDASRGESCNVTTVADLSLHELQKFYVDVIPHHVHLGMRIVDCKAGRLSIDLPFSGRLAGPDEGLHPGAITTLIDAPCGSVVPTLQRRPEEQPPSTCEQTSCFRRQLVPVPAVSRSAFISTRISPLSAHRFTKQTANRSLRPRPARSLSSSPGRARTSSGRHWMAVPHSCPTQGPARQRPHTNR